MKWLSIQHRSLLDSVKFTSGVIALVSSVFSVTPRSPMRPRLVDNFVLNLNGFCGNTCFVIVSKKWRPRVKNDFLSGWWELGFKRSSPTNFPRSGAQILINSAQSVFRSVFLCFGLSPFTNSVLGVMFVGAEARVRLAIFSPSFRNRRSSFLIHETQIGLEAIIVQRAHSAYHDSYYQLVMLCC